MRIFIRVFFLNSNNNNNNSSDLSCRLYNWHAVLRVSVRLIFFFSYIHYAYANADVVIVLHTLIHLSFGTLNVNKHLIVLICK